MGVGCREAELLRATSHTVRLGVGVDMSKEDFPADKPNNTHFVTADASYLPFRDECFDAAVSTEAFEHLNPPDAELTSLEVHRVLGDGGSFALTTPRADSVFLGLCVFAPFIVLELALAGILICCSAKYREYFRAIKARRAAQRSLAARYDVHEHVKEYTEKELLHLLSRSNFVVRRKVGTAIAESWTRFRVWNTARPLFLAWRVISTAAPRISRRLCMDICMLCERA